MSDASQHWTVALPVRRGWSSKGRAFEDAFMNKINWIFIFLIYLCVFVSVDLTLQSPVTQLKKSGPSFNLVTVLFMSDFSPLSSDGRNFLVLFTWHPEVSQGNS